MPLFIVTGLASYILVSFILICGHQCTLPPITWFPAFFAGGKRPGLGVYHSSQFSVEISNEWSCTSTLPRGNLFLKRQSYATQGHEVPHSFLTSALDRDGWSKPLPGRLTPGNETLYALPTLPFVVGNTNARCVQHTQFMT